VVLIGPHQTLPPQCSKSAAKAHGSDVIDPNPSGLIACGYPLDRTSFSMVQNSVLLNFLIRRTFAAMIVSWHASGVAQCWPMLLPP
jgi:hypothetical protein